MHDPLIIFTHIPKTAGSTLVSLLEKEYRADELVKINRHMDLPALMAKLPPETKVIRGHYPYGLHRHTPRTCRYFTILRDPVDRVISLYYFFSRQSGLPVHERIASGEETFADVARTQLNVQTAYVAGEMKAGSGEVEMLERAKQNLREDFGCCGLMERFDESLLLLEETFDWSFGWYRPKNVTRGRPARETVPRDVLEVIEETNQLDFALYDFAKSALEERIESQPGEFHDRLRKLRHRMGHLNRFSQAWNAGWDSMRRLRQRVSFSR